MPAGAAAAAAAKSTTETTRRDDDAETIRRALGAITAKTRDGRC